MQVALDPHARGRLVDPRVLEPVDVGVEQRRAAAVERERVRGHLAELAAERARVALDQVLERVDEDRDDVVLALGVGAGEISDGGHCRAVIALNEKRPRRDAAVLGESVRCPLREDAILSERPPKREDQNGIAPERANRTYVR